MTRQLKRSHSEGETRRICAIFEEKITALQMADFLPITQIVYGYFAGNAYRS